MLDALPALVGPLCGVVRDLHRVPQDPTEPRIPQVFRAVLANHRYAPPDDDDWIGAGKGATEEEAMAAAVGESVERYSSSFWDEEEVVYARARDLDGDAIDPRELVLYAPDQYSDLDYAPYSDDTVLGWMRARSLVSDRLVFVPALAIPMSYQAAQPSEHLFTATSNGLATGSCLVEAVHRGMLEVLERDAFVIAWMNRLPCTRMDASTHPDETVRGMAAAYSRRGVELDLVRLPTDHPAHVFAAVALQRHGEGPAAVVGLGASLDAADAARKAALEVGQVRPALRIRMRTPKAQARLAELVEDPRRVETLDDHDLLYTSPSALPFLDFLLEGERVPFEPVAGGGGSREDLDVLVRHLGDAGEDVLYYDLTTPDMARLHLYTARVVIPGFQPIDFGWKRQRRNGARLLDFPRRLGLRPDAASVGDLNEAPHPLA